MSFKVSRKVKGVPSLEAAPLAVVHASELRSLCLKGDERGLTTRAHPIAEIPPGGAGASTAQGHGAGLVTFWNEG